MRKRLFTVIAMVLLACPIYAGAEPIDTIEVHPTEIPVKELIPIFFSGRIASDAQHKPTHVRLLQLQWSGGEKEVASMDDNGRGEQKAGDGIYSCTLRLKETVIGLLSFRIEVTYKDNPVPVKSRPIFIRVIGGA